MRSRLKYGQNIVVPSLAVSPKHSTLELVRQDVTARAPELDNANVAPESNNEFGALQVRSSSTKMVFF